MISGKMSGISLGDRQKVRIMGIINLTKDSFYSGSVATTSDNIKQAALRLSDEGADIIDIGARSTAPYKTREVSIQSETRLLLSALRIITKIVDKPISVDTTRYEPAKNALKEGATILNDVHGFTQRDAARIANLVASEDLSLLTTAHERGSRNHLDPVASVVSCLEKSLDFATLHGIDSRKIAIDPGIGFFKDRKISNIDWNCSIIANLKELRKLGRPVCVGVSRKRFIGQLLGKNDPLDRLNGSLGATAVSVYNGAHMIRTHDVLSTLDAVKLAFAIREKGLIHYN
ncbi:MAG: dihydropteroate synthase [Nitrososphaerales archaeon]|jgi:dihydropteroate synthase